MTVRTGHWDFYLDTRDMAAFRKGKMPPEGAPMLVVRFLPHQIANVIAGDRPFYRAAEERQEEIVRWAGTGLSEKDYYCLGIMFEVAPDGEVICGEVAFRRRGYRGRTRQTWRRYWGHRLPAQPE